MANRTIAGLTTRTLVVGDVFATQAADGLTEAGKNTGTEVKAALSLNNVDNTSDANKPVSTAQQTALDAKQATLVSGTNIKTVNGTSLLGSGNVSGLPYLLYAVDFYQTGTSAPSINVILNQLSGPIVWVRSSAGLYTGTLSGAFTNARALMSIIDFHTGFTQSCVPQNANTILLEQQNGSGTNVDEVHVYLEIKAF